MYLDTIRIHMRRQTLLTILTAAMLVLAGCAGSTGGDGSPTTDGTTTPDVEPDDSDSDDGGGTATGTVQFYVSDDPGQIEDFRHLNVTITQIGFERAGGSGEMANESDDGEVENETETPENETETPEDIDDGTTTNTTTNETTTEGGSASDASGTSSGRSSDGGVAVGPQADNHENGTETPDETDGNETDSDDGETEGDEDGETEGGDGDDSKGGDGWITHDVDSRTVDLTQLKGDNATLIDSPELPAGNYSKVFVHVSDINATLTDGSSVNVKLPSNKLQLNKGFTLDPNGTVSFVYDITVFKAGNSGKYVLKPVISESGPDQQVNDVDERPDEDDGEEDDEETETEDTPEAGTPETSGPPEDRDGN